MDKERQEFIKDVLEYIEKVINVINKTTEALYNENDEDGLKNIELLANGIDYIVQAYLVINTDSRFDISNLNDQLILIVEAIENKDYILVADIFNYEIKPIIMAIMEDIKEY